MKGDADRMERFVEDRPRLDAEYAALPLRFRRRFDRFRRHDPDFRWKHEAYEMSCAVDAVKIAAACGTPEAVREFRDLPWERQREIIPTLYEGHSGNSFAFACRLASLYLTRPALVEFDHGALCILSGCEGYGHVLPTQEELRAAGIEATGDD
jgi:hypothetical protein